MSRSAKPEFDGLQRVTSEPTSSSRPEALERVRAFLRAHGTPADEITEAEAGDVLDLLVADRLLVPAERRYTQSEVAEITGMELDLARRFWRALGFPDVAPDERVFTDLDIEALVILRSMMDLGVADVDTSLQFARVIGSSMARIAEAEVSPAVRGLAIAGVRAPTTRWRRPTGSHSWPTTPSRPWRGCSSSYGGATCRPRCAAPCCCAAEATAARSRSLAVGFADMVGFTTLSQQLSEEELAAVVARFEEVAHDTVTAGGGRVVKMIGDEAMFVADSALAAARIGLALAEAYADDELLSDVRVALAVGPVLVQDGDFYGPVVNLASRVVNMAAPGAVIVTDEFHAAVESVTPGDAPGTGRRGRVRIRAAAPAPGEGPRAHPAVGAAPARHRARRARPPARRALGAPGRGARGPRRAAREGRAPDRRGRDQAGAAERGDAEGSKLE